MIVSQSLWCHYTDICYYRYDCALDTGVWYYIILIIGISYCLWYYPYWHIVLPGIWYHMVSRVVWYLAFLGISCIVLSGLPYVLVSRMSWYLVLRCIFYCLVSLASWCVVLPNISCWQADHKKHSTLIRVQYETSIGVNCVTSNIDMSSLYNTLRWGCLWKISGPIVLLSTCDGVLLTSICCFLHQMHIDAQSNTIDPDSVFQWRASRNNIQSNTIDSDILQKQTHINVS